MLGIKKPLIVIMTLFLSLSTFAEEVYTDATCFPEEVTKLQLVAIGNLVYDTNSKIMDIYEEVKELKEEVKDGLMDESMKFYAASRLQARLDRKRFEMYEAYSKAKVKLLYSIAKPHQRIDIMKCAKLIKLVW